MSCSSRFTALLNQAWLVPVAAAFTFSACAPKPATLSTPQTVRVNDSFMDLTAGNTLRIVIPITSTGGPVAPQSVATTGNTITLSAADLIGYQTSYYRLEERSHRYLRLQLTSTEVTREGRTVQNQQPSALPFHLPTRARYIRLIYLIRGSQSDHNMAVAASNSFAALEDFTSRLRQSPELCVTGRTIFCTWVPSGVAVRPD